MRYYLALCMAAVFLFVVDASAFKPKTHVWVAQQVLNDVIPDGKVTIPPFGDFAVPSEVVNALRHHPQHYRMGHVGPDAFPDVVAGQITMHPGDGWSSGEWIKHLLARSSQPEVLAFAHGYAGHAAGDTFAHTYVNLYSGDIFVLSDEQGVEVRHFSLEDFIARHTPSLVDHDNRDVPYDALDVNAEVIKDLLIYDVQDQYRTSAIHLAGMAAYRKVLTDAIELTSKYRLDLTAAVLKPQLDLLKVQLDGVERLKKLHEDLQREESGLRSQLQGIPGQIANLQNQLTGLQQQAAGLLADAGRAACLVTCEACLGVVSLPFGGSAGCDKGACQRGCNSAYDAVNNTISQVGQSITDLNTRKAQIETRLLEIGNQIIDAKNQYEKALTDEALKRARTIVADVEAAIENANVLEALLKLWRTDIDRAVTAYIVMSKEMAIEFVRGGGSPLAPFAHWVQCWAPVFSGIPSVIPQSVCTAKDFIAQLREDYQKFMLSLGSIRYVIDPAGQVAEDLKREYGQKVMDAVEAEINKGLVTLFTNLGRGDLAHVVNLLLQGSDGTTLNDIYAQDRSGKGLLRIEDVQARVIADMHVTPAGVFDAAKFRPAYNAVILAKLSLLDLAGITELMKAAGVDPVSLPSARPFNVLVDNLKSIDGNHQWQMSAPAYFRYDGWYPRAKNELRQYANTPLVFWEPEHREKVFLKLFTGPIAENLESPCPTEFRPIVHRDYPYSACLANPFPDTTRDDNKAMCAPTLRIDSLTMAEEQPHIIIANAVLNNTGGQSIGGRYQFTICDDVCKKERVLIQGALNGLVCSGRPQSRTDTVLLPYLAPGDYNFKFKVTQTGAKQPVEEVRRISVPPCSQMYTVRRGDTLIGLGEKFGMDPWKIAARNRVFTLDEIHYGKQFCIP